MAFKIVGNRLHIRSDEEMSTVDKKAADAAFKKYQNKFISPYMNEQGFLKYKSNAYVRKNKIDLLEYVEFQKERHGSKTFTVMPSRIDVSIIPFTSGVKFNNPLSLSDETHFSAYRS